MKHMHFAAPAILIIAGVAIAQPETKPAQPTPPKQSEPTLDELLGLPKQPAPDKPAAGPEIPPDQPLDPSKAQLERDLSPEEIGEAFEQAVVLMGETSQRLDKFSDTGLATQRMQEDIVRKLETLIDQAQKQQSGGGKSRKKPQQSQDQQQQQQQSSQQNQPGNNAATQDHAGPARQDGQGKPPPTGGEATWGNLPKHMREALSEGRDAKKSTMYRSKTDKYYKRLAEDPKPATEDQKP